jgi:hypothetical protein
MNDIAQESSEAISSFRQTLYMFNEDAKKAALQTTAIENTTFITLAKIDHIIFKSNAYKSIVNGKTETVFSDHHNCRLGKWYDSGEGKTRFSHLASFTALSAPHAKVHDIVLDNLKYIEHGDHTIDHKETILLSFEEMEKQSQNLFTLMDSINKESEEDLMKNA